MKYLSLRAREVYRARNNLKVESLALSNAVAGFVRSATDG